LLIAATLLLGGCAEEQAPEKEIIRPVRAAKVADPGQLKGRRWPGRASATQEVELSFRVAGPLITLPVDIGDVVKKDDIVARIDPRDFEVNVRNIQGQVERAQATLRRASSDLARLEKIYKEDPGATSEAAIDRARQQRDSARAEVHSIKASVTSAKDQLAYTYLKAPFDGIVVAKYVENFEDVRAKAPVMRIVDDSRIEMVINIPENLIGLAPQVEQAWAEFDAFPGIELDASIKEIGTEASETTRTYPVTLIMDQPDNVKILPGMAGKAWGRVKDLTDLSAVRVPISATFTETEGGKTYVWIIDEGSSTVSRREVETGELADVGIQINSGLKPGEWVATAGVHFLQEGQKVRILSQ
jgi:RND family efflux transporter MFP subunit